MKSALYLAAVLGLALLVAVSLAEDGKNGGKLNDQAKLDESYVDDDIDNDVDEDESGENSSEEVKRKTDLKAAGSDVTSSDESFENLDSSSLNDLNLDELHPNETNCRLTFSTSSNPSVPRYAVFCSKIPRFCSHVCESIKKIDFDEKIKVISPFSFSSYRAKEPLELNFKSTLAKIDADAFNGLVIEQDVQMKINIIGNADELNSKIIYIDPEIKGTQAARQKQLQSLSIMPNAFRGINVMEGGRLLVTIRNMNKIVFDSQSLTGFKQLARSSVIFSIDHITDVIFKSKCAKSWQAYNKLSSRKDDIKIVDLADDYENNLINKQTPTPQQSNEFKHIEKSIANVLFKLNLTNIDTAVFETDSFSDLKQSKQSAFQILISKFNDAKFGRLSFNRLKQNFMSSFELSLTAGRRVLVSEQAFANLLQAEKSRYTLYMDIGESSICLPAEAFVNFTQQAESTARLSFGLNYNNNLVLRSQAVKNVVQERRSLFQIVVSKPFAAIFENQAFTAVSQSKQSSFELSVLSARSHCKFEAASIVQFKQGFESVLRISMASLPQSKTQSSSKAIFKQSTNTFNNFVSYPTAQVVYDLAPGIKYELKFPQRPIPRMMPSSLNGGSVEEFAYKNFPNLGRLSRPDLIDLRSLNLKADDFCKVVDIPFDVLVRLRPATECSCSVYYLYRKIRLFSRLTVESDDMEFPPLPYNGDEANTWLKNAPDCYRSLIENAADNKFEANSAVPKVIKDIKALEQMCKFEERVDKCRVREQEAAAISKDGGGSEKLLGQCLGGSFEFYQAAASIPSDTESLRPVMSQQTVLKSNKGEFNSVENDDSEYDSDEDKVTKDDEEVVDDEDDDDEDKDDSASNEEEDEVGSDEVIIDDQVIDVEEEDGVKKIPSNSQNTQQLLEGASFVERSTLAVYRMLSSSSTVALVIIVITSIVLIGIVIFVAFILKFRHREILYSEEYKDDDDDDDSDDNDDDSGEDTDDSDDEQYHRMKKTAVPDTDKDHVCQGDHYHEGVCDPQGCHHTPPEADLVDKIPTARIANPAAAAASKFNLANFLSMSSNVLKRKRLQQKQYSYSAFDKDKARRQQTAKNKPTTEENGGQNFVVVNCCDANTNSSSVLLNSRAASTTTTSSIINLQPLDIIPTAAVMHASMNVNYDHHRKGSDDSGTVSNLSIDDEVDDHHQPPTTENNNKFINIKTNPFSVDDQA